jgi:hypothetical protein
MPNHLETQRERSRSFDKTFDEAFEQLHAIISTPFNSSKFSTVSLYHYRTLNVPKTNSIAPSTKHQASCLNTVHHDSLPLYNSFGAFHNS